MKIPRYKLVTLLLVAYALFMTLYFGTELLKSGEDIRFYLTAGSEAIVITLTYFALRRRDRLRDLRKEEDKNKG